MFDMAVSVVSLLIGILTVYFASQLPKPIFAGQMGTGVFPTFIGVGIIVVSVLLFLESVRKKPEKISPADRIVFWSILLIGAYVLFFKTLGFLLASFMFIFAMGYLLGARKYLSLTLISLLFPTVIYFLFKSLGIVLPQGLLPF